MADTLADNGAVAPADGPDTGHDYDGIRELDNRLPNWWLASLVGAIVFGFAYWTYYQVFHAGPTEMAAYHAELAQAERAAKALQAAHPLDDATLVAMSKKPAVVAAGSATFHSTCAACHGANAQGLIGPNLTDAYWIHGGRPTEILHTVTSGVPAKGMPTWGPVLGATRVQQVVAYLLTIRDTDVPGKPPQGQLYQTAIAPGGK